MMGIDEYWPIEEVRRRETSRGGLKIDLDANDKCKPVKTADKLQSKTMLSSHMYKKGTVHTRGVTNNEISSVPAKSRRQGTVRDRVVCVIICELDELHLHVDHTVRVLTRTRTRETSIYLPRMIMNSQHGVCHRASRRYQGCMCYILFRGRSAQLEARCWLQSNDWTAMAIRS